jgi:hypothetical protein
MQAGCSNSLSRFNQEIRQKLYVGEFVDLTVDLTSQIKRKISFSLNLVPNYVS